MRHRLPIVLFLLLFTIGILFVTFLYTTKKDAFLYKPRAETRSCPLSIKGDANCDDKIDLTDFDIWSKQYAEVVKCERADFNNDYICDMVDYGIWHTGYTGGE